MFLISTHSPVFIDQNERAAEILLVERQSGVSSVRSVKTDVEVTLEALGVRLSDVMSSDRVVLVEGASDAVLLREWFPDLLDAHGISVVSMNGGDGSRHVDSFIEWIRTIDVLSRRIVFLRDRDELDSAEVQQFEATGKGRVIPCREIENYLLDCAAIARVLTDRTGSDVDQGAVCERLEALVDAARNEVIIKRTADSLGRNRTLRLVDRQLIAQLVRDSADLSMFRSRVEERLSQADEILPLITQRWLASVQEISDAWKSDRYRLVGGSDILERLWRENGLRYDKKRDGVRLAQRISAPEELRLLLEELFRR